MVEKPSEAKMARVFSQLFGAIRGNYSERGTIFLSSV